MLSCNVHVYIAEETDMLKVTPQVAGGAESAVYDYLIKGLFSVSVYAFSALTLLVGRQEQHPACKLLSGGVLAWLSVWSEVQTCT